MITKEHEKIIRRLNDERVRLNKRKRVPVRDRYTISFLGTDMFGTWASEKTAKNALIRMFRQHSYAGLTDFWNAQYKIRGTMAGTTERAYANKQLQKAKLKLKAARETDINNADRLITELQEYGIIEIKQVLDVSPSKLTGIDKVINMLDSRERSMNELGLIALRGLTNKK